MRNKLVLVALAVVAALTASCCKRVMVAPAMDLVQHEVLGMIQLEVNEKGKLAPYATSKFMEAITEDQKGIRIVELGTRDEVLAAVGMSALGPEAFQAIGEKYGVKSVFVGNIEVSDVKPRIEIGLVFPHVSASADVEAAMSCRLVETGLGATVWTGSARDKRQVGNVTIFRDFFSFDAEDPDAAYGPLVQSLVRNSTKDFRVTWKCVRG